MHGACGERLVFKWAGASGEAQSWVLKASSFSIRKAAIAHLKLQMSYVNNISINQTGVAKVTLSGRWHLGRQEVWTEWSISRNKCLSVLLEVGLPVWESSESIGMLDQEEIMNCWETDQPNLAQADFCSLISLLALLSGFQPHWL